MLEIERRVSGWTVSEAAETYDIARWGDGYFSVNASGNIAVHPTRSPDRAIDLKLLVDRLVARGIQTPVLLRFADILKGRL
ncbi:MAG: arginine decarboxylase, partial [Pirellulales bacterium]|nr:arginine decarboxylase [Pirellulales bacterium]